MAKFLRTHDIFSVLNDMIREAENFLVIVSPFIILDGEQKLLLKKAAENGVPITIIYRLDDRQTAKRLKDFSDLPGIKIIGCPELHAKIYATENAAILSSKNLTTREKDCSIEIGIVFDYREDFYDSLLETARELRDIPDSEVLVDNSEDLSRKQMGYCIRCGRQIELDKDHPLCNDCLAVWRQFGNRDYEENYCHFCGKRADGIAYSLPVELNCYAQYSRVYNYQNRPSW